VELSQNITSVLDDRIEYVSYHCHRCILSGLNNKHYL